MQTILCLGSSHTEGGHSGDRSTKSFENSWPGLLESWLHQQGRDDRVINMGAASYSIENYAYKLLRATEEWNIDHVIVELNTPHKLDIEITPELHDHALPGTAIQDRYTIATREGRTGWPEDGRKYRSSVSTTEAVDYYHTWFDNTKPADSYTASEMASEMRGGQLSDQERGWVSKKLDGLISCMPGTDRAHEILIDYLYFRAVYESLSDHAIVKYCSQIDHIQEICRNKGIRCTLWLVHDASEWSGSAVYVNTFRQRWKDLWLFDEELYAFKPWLQMNHSAEQIKLWQADAIHWHSDCWKQWVDKHLGPWLTSKK